MSYTAHEEVYRGYTIKIEADDHDRENPYEDFEQASQLVLHEHAEDHFGWSTDKDMSRGLQSLLAEVRERRWARSVPGDSNSAGNLYGKGGAMDVVYRWARAFGGIRMAIPFSALEHSGTAVYLGTGFALGDPGGWDSGWVGVVLITNKAVTENWMGEDVTDEQIQKLLESEFETFRAWVQNEVYGYVVEDPEGDQIASCWGFYGDREWSRSEHYPDGFMQSEARAEIDADILAREIAAAEIEAHEHHRRFALYRGLVSS